MTRGVKIIPSVFEDGLDIKIVISIHQMHFLRLALNNGPSIDHLGSMVLVCQSPTMLLANFAAQTKFEQIPEKVIHEAKRTLIDSLGCGLAATQTEKGRICVEFARRLGGPPEATIMGAGYLVPSPSAAFANAELIVDLDFDTILCPPHLSPAVISASLAAAESLGVSGADFLTALVIGLEVGSRIGTSVSGLWGMWFERGMRFERGIGFEPVSVYIGMGHTVFGAAASVSKILGFDGMRIANTFGIASQFAPAPTTAKFLNTPHSPMYKYALLGACAQAGVMAALLTQLGYTGDTTILDGDTTNPEICDWERLTGGLGEKWLHVEQAFGFKPYPVCRVQHSLLDAFLSIVSENDLTPEDIDSVVVKGSPSCLVPLRKNRDIRSPYDAQFSVPYAIAVAAYLPKPSPRWTSPETIKDPKILKFMDKIRVEVIEGIGLGGYVKITSKGKIFEKEVKIPKGSPVEGFRTTDKELEEKFYTNASGILSNEKMRKILTVIYDLDRLKNIRELTRLLTIEK
jgi:2-methylcitrate dehydratase PrpD